MLAIANGKSSLIVVERTNNKIVLQYNDGQKIRLHLDAAIALAMEIICLYGKKGENDETK